jgi:hypothetical protein
VGRGLLPGTEGDGVADLLLQGGSAPVGRPSPSWPRSMAQIPINVGDPDYTTDPPESTLGFGLTYREIASRPAFGDAGEEKERTRFNTTRDLGSGIDRVQRVLG